MGVFKGWWVCGCQPEQEEEVTFSTGGELLVFLAVLPAGNSPVKVSEEKHSRDTLSQERGAGSVSLARPLFAFVVRVLVLSPGL